MTYFNALKKIHSFPRTAGAPTVERMRLLCKYLGDPQKKLKFVHIAGTNGKGSCAAMLDSVLREAGYKTGRFVSPYVLDFRERMTFDGEMITPSALCEHTKTVLDAVSRMEKDIDKARNGEDVPFRIPQIILEEKTSAVPVQFEVVTAIGFLFFAACKSDVVILECGLGGKYDATNVIDPPLAAVIMSVGLDHTELLGDTVELIAAEKCGIIKSGTSEIISYPQEPSVMAVISDAAVKANARITVPVRNELKLLRTALMGPEFIYCGKKYRASLAAPYQMLNAATVIEVCAALARAGMKLDYDAVSAGIAKTSFPARFEVLGVSPTVIVDGAHNAHGISAFCDSMGIISDCFKGNLTFIVGMLSDKDPRGALLPFAELVKSGVFNVGRIITLTPDSPRSMKASELGAILSEMMPEDIDISCLESKGKQLEGELLSAIGKMERSDALVSFGSLYLAADIRKLLVSYLEKNMFGM